MVEIFNKDCLEGLANIEDNSVDLFLFSPPYDSIRDYKGFSFDLNKLGPEIARTLKDGGICVMVIQDGTDKGRKSGTTFKTIANWITNTDLDLWECCIYYRSGTPGAWWNKRFRVDHEYIPIFIKGQRPNFFDKSHMLEDTKPEYGRIKKGLGNRRTDGKTDYDKEKVYELPDQKSQGTVIHYLNSSRETPKSSKIGRIKLEHPATFPEKMASDFIRCFTKEGDLVVDPFLGSGTTAVQAKKLNRNFIGFEISPEYTEISNKRLNME